MRITEFAGYAALAAAAISAAAAPDTASVDAKNSTVRLIARSGEPNAPVMGERLQCEITLRDAHNHPIGGFPGNAITLVSMEQDGLHSRSLEGLTAPDTGRLYAVFEPHAPRSAAAIRLAVKIGGQVLNSMPRVTFNPAAETVDQSQPLWSGSQELFGQLTIGQTFTTGDITNITRIKLMLKPGAEVERLPPDALRLYVWRGDYAATRGQPPLARSRGFRQSARDLLGEFQMDAAVQPRQKYYFELEFALSSSHATSGERCYMVWRVSSSPTSRFPLDAYPPGMAFWCGTARPEWDLMFYVLTSTTLADTAQPKTLSGYPN